MNDTKQSLRVEFENSSIVNSRVADPSFLKAEQQKSIEAFIVPKKISNKIEITTGGMALLRIVSYTEMHLEPASLVFGVLERE